MKRRGSFDGVCAVARFNWPFYAVAAAVLAGCAVGLLFIRMPWMQVGLVMVGMGCFYFIFVSLGVSHWVYDCSDLFRWKWLERALRGVIPGRMVFCHSGFDESSGMLAEKFPGADWRILDHHDPRWMNEPSIRRARRLFPPVGGTVAAPFDAWPVESGWANVVFGLLAIHELRTVDDRAAWFCEAGRCLCEDGRIVIVEHLRNSANFLAFGPGFLHFHSQEAWGESWGNAGLTLQDEFRLTPFLKVFVLRKND